MDEVGCFPNLTATLPGLTAAHGDVELVYARRHSTYGSWVATATVCDYAGDLKALLERPFLVADADGNECFCGFIDQAYRCCGDYMAWGWDSREIINRLAIAYTVGGERRRTAWAEDGASIAAYGQRALVLDLPTDSLWPTPELYRDRILAEFSQPRPILRNTYPCDCNRTYLHVTGAWRSLAWQVYEDDCGLFEAAPNAAERKPFGIGFRSDGIGFRGGYIGNTGVEFAAFDVDDAIVIRGAAEPRNNIVTTITGFAGDPIRYTSNGIRLEPTDDVVDANERLTQFAVNQMVGLAAPVVLNAGCYFVTRVVGDGARIEVYPSTLVSENLTGSDVTISGGVSIRVPDDIDAELPGAMVTITSFAQMVCQALCNNCHETVTINRVRVKLSKVGAPSDQVQVTLAASCSGAGESSLLAGATVGHGFDYFEFDFADGVVVGPGACAYARIERTGAPDTTDYYELAGDSAVGLRRAQMSPDGVNWRTAGYAAGVAGIATLPLGALLTQMATSWLGAGEVAVATAISDITVGGAPFRAPIYRDGSRTLLFEIEQLLALGDPEGGRLRLYIDCNSNIVIDKAPRVEDGVTVISCDGYPTAMGLCALRAGQWMGAPAGTNDVDPVYLDWLELKVGSKECRVRYVERHWLLSELGYTLHYAGAR